MEFGRLGRRVIEANFQGGALSSDGGLMLLRQMDRRLGLSESVATVLHDPRDPDRIRHTLRDLVAQRLYGLCCGYEDLNDHDQLRHDPLAQTAVGKDSQLASAPTLAWPQVRLIVRGDSGFCRQPLIRWCEQSGVGYLIGLARNAALHREVEGWEKELRQGYDTSRETQRLVREFRYQAGSWKVERRVITRLEYGEKGTNPRFVVTNLDGEAAPLYDRVYCQRGEAENRIKEVQLDLFGARASSQKFLANWLRLMWAALGYTLMQHLRSVALAGTELAQASAATIRVRLLKIGASILRNTRRIRVMLASSHPMRTVYLMAALALSP